MRGVVTQTGLEFRARAVVLTAGTFLGGDPRRAQTQYAGGRAGDPPANRARARACASCRSASGG